MRYSGVLLAAGLIGLALSSPAFSSDIILDVTAWKGNEAEPAGLPELVEKFEKENPGIDVELSYISRLDTDVVLPPRLQGDNAPDVMMTDMPLVKVWSDAGLLADLGTERPWFSKIEPALLPAVTAGDAVYIMPLEVIGMGNFVNMDLLGKVGIETAPKTLDDLKTTCGKLADAGIKPLILTGSFSAPLFVIANGIEAADGKAAPYGAMEKQFSDDEAFGSALDSVRELIDARCLDPKDQAGLDPWSTALTAFKSGDFAMMPQGAWNIADFSSVDGLNFAFAPIPSSKPSGVALDLFGIGWSISANSKNQEAARKFVEFFTEEENLQIMLEAESAYSPFVGGQSGTSSVTSPYDEARVEGGVIMYPFAVLDWPKPLEKEIWDSLTGFLLDTEKSNDAVLERWDEAVEDS